MLKIHDFFLAYGIASDVDIESEVIRGLGSLRFTIYTILRIANLRKYKVKLWYKKAFSNNQNQEESNEPEEEDIYSEAKTVSSSSETDEESEREKSESEQEINFQKQEIPTSQNEEENSEEEEDDKMNEQEEEETKVDSDDENSEEKSERNSLHSNGESNEASSEMSENENDVEVQEVTMDIGQASTNHGSEIMTHDSPYFPGGHRATYGLMLAQGHLYFRSWNELQATLLPQMVEFKPLPPMPPRPARQKLDTEVPELSQDLKTESHDGWIYEENEFINISILNAPYATEDVKFSPEVIILNGRFTWII